MRTPGPTKWLDDGVTVDLPDLAGIAAISRIEPALKEAIVRALIDAQAVLMAALTRLDSRHPDTVSCIAEFFNLSEMQVDKPFTGRLRDDYSALLGYLRAVEASDGKIFGACSVPNRPSVVAVSQSLTGSIRFHTEPFIMESAYRRAWCVLHELSHTVLGGIDFFYAEIRQSAPGGNTGHDYLQDVIDLHHQMTRPHHTWHRRLPAVIEDHRSISIRQFLTAMKCRTLDEADTVFRFNDATRVGLLMSNPDSVLTLIYMLAGVSAAGSET